MLGLQRRIVLEDNMGEKHAHYLLDTIEERYFVLLPPAAAEAVSTLQASTDENLDEALEILAESVVVLSLRDHRFLTLCDVPPVLARSRHHALVLAGVRMADLPTAVIEEEVTPVAFMDECRKRLRW